MEDKKIMIEFQNRIDALEAKIEKISSQMSSCISMFGSLQDKVYARMREYNNDLLKVFSLVLVLLFLTIFVASYVFWG